MSRDPQEVADAFAASLELPFPLVGDPGGSVGRAYEATWPVIGKARRVTYLIGRDRRVRLAYASELRIDAHAARACAAVAGGPGSS